MPRYYSSRSGLACLLIVMAVVTSGCASGPRISEVAAAPPDKALVYIYRERRGAGSAGSPNLFINGQKVVKLKSGGYFMYTAEPGELVFSNELAFGPLGALWAAVDRMAEAKKRSVLEFQADAGKVYFVEWSLGFKVNLRTREEAWKTLSDCSELKGTTE